MALDYDTITEILTSAPGNYVIRRTRQSDGAEEVFRGRDIQAFYSRGDAHLHEHKVYDSTGTLVYHRDIHGRVQIGSTAQMEKSIRRQKMGRAAVTGAGIFRESLRKAIDFNMRNLRGGR